MTDKEAYLLQILDGTPHSHLFRRFSGEWCRSTDFHEYPTEMCEGLLRDGLIRWNGHGYYITQTGKDAVREAVREMR